MAYSHFETKFNWRRTRTPYSNVYEFPLSLDFKVIVCRGRSDRGGDSYEVSAERSRPITGLRHTMPVH
jgi:hypothetical protein